MNFKKLFLSSFFLIPMILAGNLVQAQDYSQTTPKKKSKALPATSKSKMAVSRTNISDIKPLQTVSASSVDERAAAIRMLANGDEATRKARLASLQRIGAAMAKKKGDAQRQAG